MVAVRPADADAALARLDPARLVILLFGPDAGLVRERARLALARAQSESTDPFGTVRLEGDEVAGDPGRLIDEAGTISMFGGRRLVSVRAGAKNLAPAVEALLAAAPAEALVVIEASDLKRGAPLRTLCEASPRALAIACYADTERDLARLVDAMMTEAGLTLERDARAELLGLIGGDRMASRSEIAKLILYVGDERRVTTAHVRAIVGDASALALDEVADAALTGATDEAGAAFAKALADGARPDVLLGAVGRAVLALHALRLAVEAGTPPDRAVEGARPPLHFSRRPKIAAALRAWTAPRLVAALLPLDEALLAARRNTALGQAIAERALFQLAASARRGSPAS